MKGRKIKILALTMLIGTLCVLNPTMANAEWKKDNVGWWYSEGSSWTTGWKQINGKWYYFKQDGYMLQNCRTPDGCWVNLYGEYIPTDLNKKENSMFTIGYDDDLNIRFMCDGKQEKMFNIEDKKDLHPLYLKYTDFPNTFQDKGSYYTIKGTNVRDFHLENINGEIKLIKDN